jgi:hypothetical protein
MTRFSFKGDVTNGFGDKPRNFRVMAENQAGLEAWMGKLGNVVSDAMSVLQAAIAAPDGPEKSAAIETYFLTGPTPDSSDVLTIKNLLNKTLTGLKSGQFGVKIHDKVAMNQAKEAAFVRPVGTMLRRPDNPQKKPHHNIRTKADGTRDKVGAVHYSQRTLETGGPLVIRVMIHEATHKFCATRDFSYYSVPEGVQLKPMTKAEALNNADSYAMYAMAVGFASITPNVTW